MSVKYNELVCIRGAAFPVLDSHGIIVEHMGKGTFEARASCVCLDNGNEWYDKELSGIPFGGAKKVLENIEKKYGRVWE